MIQNSSLEEQLASLCVAIATLQGQLEEERELKGALENLLLETKQERLLLELRNGHEIVCRLKTQGTTCCHLPTTPVNFLDLMQICRLLISIN